MLSKTLDLDELRTELRRLADLSPLMVWITDKNGDCLYLNGHWQEFTGQTPEESAGFGWAEAIHESDRQGAVQAFVANSAKHLPYHVEYRLCRLGGRFEWVTDAGHPYWAPNGDLGGYIGSVSTIGAVKVGMSEGRLLTPREREVVGWIARGKTSAEIATVLSIAARTVEQHATSAMVKLGATNRVQTAVEAIRLREIEL